MRVYEFSKKSGISSRELLEALRKKGFEVGNHMSVLAQKEIDFLTEQFISKAPKAVEKSSEVKVQAQAQQEKKAVVIEKNVKPIAQSKSHEESLEVPISTTKSTESLDKKFVKDAVLHPEASQEPVVKEKAPGGQFFVQSMTVLQASHELKQPVTSVILTLLKWGVVANKNQLLKEDVVNRLAHHYEMTVVKKENKERQETRTVATQTAASQERYPVVVVVGHVDHGKTTLLDFIRKTRVAAREKGGITQHLGAYEATTPQGNVVFIDTPGHEAFSKMRMRGVRVADIVVLVVAADDGVMPQTIEALKAAKAMEVPIIVAINKVDKVDAARVEGVKQELSRHDLLAEEWGGSVIVVPISAKTGKGIDQLLEMIILQSQLMELRADASGPAKGYVLESKLEKGRGPVATFLAQTGKIAVGDYFMCGSTVGRVSSLIDSHGARVQDAGPSIPVRIAGFSTLPEAGDYCEVVPREEYLKARSTGAVKDAPYSRAFAKEGVINIMIKTDTNSSKEALLGSIQKLSKSFEKQFNVISANIGDINESDIALAATTGSKIFGLHIKVGPNAATLAQKHRVSIELFDIIYKLLEHLEAVAEGAKEIKMVREKIGEAVVRKVFDIKGLGVIAGSYVRDGRFTKDGSAVVFRGNKKVGEGKIKSLQRDKKVVKEVHTGYECGFLIDGFNEFEIDDRVECFIEVPEKSKK